MRYTIFNKEVILGKKAQKAREAFGLFYFNIKKLTIKKWNKAL